MNWKKEFNEAPVKTTRDALAILGSLTFGVSLLAMWIWNQFVEKDSIFVTVMFTWAAICGGVVPLLMLKMQSKPTMERAFLALYLSTSTLALTLLLGGTVLILPSIKRHISVTATVIDTQRHMQDVQNKSIELQLRLAEATVRSTKHADIQDDLVAMLKEELRKLSKSNKAQTNESAPAKPPSSSPWDRFAPVIAVAAAMALMLTAAYIAFLRFLRLLLLPEGPDKTDPTPAKAG